MAYILKINVLNQNKGTIDEDIKTIIEHVYLHYIILNINLSHLFFII